MSRFKDLSIPKKVLVSLLKVRCCSRDQISECFSISSPYAYMVLKRLLNDGLVSSQPVHKRLNSYAYALTPLGYERAVADLAETPFYMEIDSTGKRELVPKYKVVYTRLESDAILHALSTYDFYYLFLKNIDFEQLNWYGETSERVNVRNGTTIAKSDAMIELHNTEYHIEVDMGTEDRTQLNTKFLNYGKALEGRTDLPNIVISINYSYTLVDEATSRNGNIKKLKEELNNLRETYSMNKTEMNILKSLKGRTKDQLMADKRATEMFLQDSIVKPRLRKEYIKRIELIDMVLNDQSSISAYLASNVKINELEAEERRLKNQYKAAELEQRYNSRIRYIKDIISTNDFDSRKEERPLSIYKTIIEAGLNVYVNSHHDTKKFMLDQVIYKNKNIDIITKYLELKLREQYSNSTDISISVDVNGYMDYYIKRLTASRMLQSIYRNPGNNSSTLVNEITLIEDVSYNNIGGYLRILEMIQHIKPNKNNPKTSVYIIVDSEDQADEISKLIANFYADPGVFTYINKNSIQEYINQFQQTDFDRVSLEHFEAVNFDLYRIIDEMTVPVLL